MFLRLRQLSRTNLGPWRALGSRVGEAQADEADEGDHDSGWFGSHEFMLHWQGFYMISGEIVGQQIYIFRHLSWMNSEDFFC